MNDVKLSHNLIELNLSWFKALILHLFAIFAITIKLNSKL